MKSLDGRIEKWMSVPFDVIVDFGADDAFDKPDCFNLFKKVEDGALCVVSSEDALEIVDDYRDNSTPYANRA